MSEIGWENAKEILETTPEPTAQERLSATSFTAGSHEFGRQVHNLICSKYDFKIGEFEAQFIWYICPKCNKILGKSFVVFNNKLNTSYTKDLVRKGKPIEEGASS